MSLKNILNFRTKYFILLQLQKFKSSVYFKDLVIKPNKKYAFIFLAADYGNLGDVAITYAQTKFLNDNLGDDLEVIEIPISQSLEGLNFVKKNIKPGDIVTSVGGGNLGDMYDQIEYIRQLTVRYFPKNKFISFPQTFDFSGTIQGIKSLRIAQKVYNAHPNMFFIAREKTSFKLMKEHFNKTTVLLTPDIVISLDKEKPIQNRSGAVICMRSDKEKNISENQSNYILNEIKSRFDLVTFNDTHINRSNLSIEERETELEKIWNTFKSAELVVTDRLHGMIFCFITNTPCLVFQNNNHKVRETYDWIKENKNINLVTEYSEERIKKFLEQPNFNIGQTLNVTDRFEPIKRALS